MEGLLQSFGDFCPSVRRRNPSMLNGKDCLIESMHSRYTTIIGLRQKHGRKHPWLDSAAYLLINYIEYSKINPQNKSIVSLSPRSVAPKLIKAALD